LCLGVRALVPPDELLSWTDEEVEHEIVRHVIAYICEWRDGAWCVCIEVEGGAAFAAEHVDRRMALYDVYGHLWMKDHRGPAPGSPWDFSTPRPTVASVTQQVHSILEDPADVDPAEVASVYGLSSQKG
jgi:hypothetical protein